MAGALEPCGCVKDMLGGVDHAAAFVRDDVAAHPGTLIVGAGPMLFLNRTLPAVGGEQHRFKAQAIAESFRALGLRRLGAGRERLGGRAGRAVAPRAAFRAPRCCPPIRSVPEAVRARREWST